MEYEFTLRAADGTVQIVREAHRLGAFRRDTWLRLLADAGFEPEARFAGDCPAGERQAGDRQAGGGPEAGMPAHLFIGWRRR